MKIEESGIYSMTFRHALAYAKRKAAKEAYSFTELILDAKYQYYLTEAETEALQEKLVVYCKKNLLYIGRM